MKGEVTAIRSLALAGLLCVASGCRQPGTAPESADAGKSPQETMLGMAVAEGLEVTLFAAEPDLRNPTAMDVDAQGRVWVTEAVNYRLFRHEVAEAAGDRVRVLEDRDRDGRVDKASTFYQDPSLQAPLGIAVLGDRVYVAQSPELFYLEDRDQDGVADAKTVVLEGFGGVDHDHALHGLTFGPDGKIYMTNGDSGLDVTDGRGHRLQAGKKGEPFRAATVLRTDLDGQQLELLAEGMRNPYEPAVDSFGNVFASDNDDDGNQQCRINQVLGGGYYGYWPKIRGDRRRDSVHWNQDRPGVVPKLIKTGFGSPSGITMYEGRLLPERFQNALIHADAGPGVIRAYQLAPRGAGFQADIEILLANQQDSWFRPIDVAVAPDGSILVADWYDPGVGGHRMGDTAAGRIYRIAPPGSRYSVPLLDLHSDGGLREALSSPNPARRFLAFQKVKSKAQSGDTRLLEALLESPRGVIRARALWLLGLHSEQRLDRALTASRDPDPRIRMLSVRLLASQAALTKAPWLKEDADPAVRRQLILALAGVRDRKWAQDWLSDLALAFDGQDRFYREALGIAVRGREIEAWDQILRLAGRTWNRRLAGLSLQLHPPAALSLARRAALDEGLDPGLRETALRTVDAIGGSAAGGVLYQLATNGPVPLQRVALNLLGRDGGRVWLDFLATTRIDDFLRQALHQPEVAEAAATFISECGRIAFFQDFLGRALDTSLGIEERREALKLASQVVATRIGEAPVFPSEDVVRLLQERDPEIQTYVVWTLNAFGYDQANQILKDILVDPSRGRPLREETVKLLAGSKSGALLLLNLAEAGDLPADLELLVADRLHSSSFEDIKLLAKDVLPREVTAEGVQLPSIDRLVSLQGDQDKGRQIFFRAESSQCFQCHRVDGEGRNVGPDLSRIGHKYGRRELYESIINPSAAIGHEYQPWVLRTTDQGYLIGFIGKETDTEIELVDSGGQVTSVSKSKLIQRHPSPTSLMPNGLVSGMTVQELVDVVAFLSERK